MGLKEIITENILLKILSFVISVLLWAYVIYSENPIVYRTIVVKPHVKNLDEKRFYIMNEIKDMHMEIGIRRLDMLNRDILNNIRVELDLSGLKKGKYELVPIIKGNNNIEIKSIKPKKMKIIIGEISKKELEIFPHITKLTDLYILNLNGKKITLVPEKVMVKGKQEILDRIKQAVIFIDIFNEGRFNKKCKVFLLDKNQNQFKDPSNSVIIEPSEVTAKFSVAALIEKNVKVKVVTKGLPLDGYKIKEIDINPPEVLIKGIPEIVKDIFSVTTEVIDVNGIDRSIKRNVYLKSISSDITINPYEITTVIKVVKSEDIKRVVAVLKGEEKDKVFLPKNTVEILVHCNKDFSLDSIEIFVKKNQNVKEAIFSWANKNNVILKKIIPEDIKIGGIK